MLEPGFWRGLTAGIVSSLVAGILLVYLIQPVFDFLPGAILRGAGAVSQGYADMIYRNAAQRLLTSDRTTPLMTSLLTLLAMFWLTELFVERFAPQHIPTFKRRIHGWLVPFLLLYAATVVVLDSVVSLVASPSSDIEQCFRSRLAVLAPHLSDRESKEAVAAWMLMRNRSDFDAINRTLAEYAEKYNVPSVRASLQRDTPTRCR